MTTKKISAIRVFIEADEGRSREEYDMSFDEFIAHVGEAVNSSAYWGTEKTREVKATVGKYE